MGERLKRIWIAYKKYRLVMRIVAGFVGIIVGISGCVAFATVYQNYHAAAWAGVSAVYAFLFVCLHIVVRRDHERLISRDRFTGMMWGGFGGVVSGFIVFVVNIAFGIKNHESGVNAKGNFIVCVWAFMTFKWGLLSFLAARRFRKTYYESDPQNRALVQSI